MWVETDSPQVFSYLNIHIQSSYMPCEFLHLRYGGLNVIGPHNIIGSGTTRRHGFVGKGMALLEKFYRALTGGLEIFMRHICRCLVCE